MIISIDNVDQISFETSIIDFDINIQDEHLLTLADKINNFPVYLQTIVINLKSLSYNNKLNIIKYFLQNNTLVHPQFVLNLINLIKNYNNLSDDFFNNEKVIFSNIEEFLNIKLELKDDIQKFINDFSLYYCSLFMSLHKIESNFLDNIKQLPLTYRVIIQSLDFVTLSGICSKASTLNKPNFYIANALDIFSLLTSKINFTNEIMQTFISNIKSKL